MSGVFQYQSMDTPDHRGSGDAGTSGHSSMGNGQNGNGRMSPSSPLKLFGQAKKNINEIFKDVLDFLSESYSFVEDIEKKNHIEEINCKDHVKVCRERVCGIMEVLCRDHMKVVFFGRTSNGKSTTINALLREKILPTGIGHTTNCFLQVEGSDSHEGYLLTEEEPDKPKSVQSIKQLASALSNVKLKENSLIRILWPKNKCRLLREDVVLVDSPGIDVTPDLDLWIDKFCLDADVFVLVSNAESTLMQTEKNFFHKVSSRLSKPNIFIIQNRWDISAFEDDVDQVKQQHLDRNLEFLCDELTLMDRGEVANRVFFVSSREALASRLKEQGTPTPSGILQEGFQERLSTFSNFERVFEECLSKSAVRTKFEQHTNRGKSIITDMRNILEKILSTSHKQTDDAEKSRREMADELDYMEKQLQLLVTEIKDKIKNMVEDVERKVSSTLNDEIKGLSTLVDKFDRPFHPDDTSLNIYKKELHVYIEESIIENLHKHCSGIIRENKDELDRHMIERLSALLPEEEQQQIQNVLPKRDEFEIAYRLDCRNLFADFQIPRKLTYVPNIGLKTMIADLCVGVMIYKTVGRKVLVIGGLLYAGVYGYERLSWTNRAKERFKGQYVDYASSKLRLIVKRTSRNCSRQVQQELTSTFVRLCNQADITKSRLEDKIKQKDINIEQLKDISKESKAFRHKADSLDKALDTFKETFLSTL